MGLSASVRQRPGQGSSTLSVHCRPPQLSVNSGSRSSPARFVHAVNSKTPSTRIATSRRGRNREEAVMNEADASAELKNSQWRLHVQQRIK